MIPKPFKRVRLKMGPPMRFDPALHLDGGGFTGAGDGGLTGGDYRRITDEMMAAIAALSGQEYVPAYASRDRGRLSAPGSDAEPTPVDERLGLIT
jgi:hypothetical protein